MAATRGETPIQTDSVTVRDHTVDVTERDCAGARCELVVERGGERWRLRVHHDDAIEPVAERASPPPWVARAVRRYEFATRDE